MDFEPKNFPSFAVAFFRSIPLLGVTSVWSKAVEGLALLTTWKHVVTGDCNQEKCRPLMLGASIVLLGKGCNKCPDDMLWGEVEVEECRWESEYFLINCGGKKL